MREISSFIGARPPLSDANTQSKKYVLHPVSAGTRPTPAHLFLAGVQAMRARICSAFSCAMFARVVYLKPWRAAKLPTFALSFAARTCHALLLATNSCTRGMNQCTQCVGWRRRDRGRVLKERGTLSLMAFGTFGHAKVRERKSGFI